MGLLVRLQRWGAALTVAGLLAAVPATADAGRFWRSLLVPGWGQRAAGHDGAAARFAAVEASLWAGWLGLRGVADVREKTYRTWAATHAGAQTRGQPKAFFDDLGFYETHHQHDQYALVDDGPQAELYADASASTWAWDAEASRQRFRRLRNDATAMERNAIYVTGLLVVNHLVAAVHAARAPEALSGAPEPPGVTLQGRPRPGGGLELALTRRF